MDSHLKNQHQSTCPYLQLQKRMCPGCYCRRYCQPQPQWYPDQLHCRRPGNSCAGPGRPHCRHIRWLHPPLRNWRAHMCHRNWRAHTCHRNWCAHTCHRNWRAHTCHKGAEKSREQAVLVWYVHVFVSNKNDACLYMWVYAHVHRFMRQDMNARPFTRTTYYHYVHMHIQQMFSCANVSVFPKQDPSHTHTNSVCRRCKSLSRVQRTTRRFRAPEISPGVALMVK